MGVEVPDVIAVERIGVAANWQASGGWTDGAHRLGTSPEKDVGFPYRSALVPRRNGELDERMTRYSWQSYLIATASFAEWIDRGRPAPPHRKWSQYLGWVADQVDMSRGARRGRRAGRQPVSAGRCAPTRPPCTPTP